MISSNIPKLKHSLICQVKHSLLFEEQDNAHNKVMADLHDYADDYKTELADTMRLEFAERIDMAITSLGRGGKARIAEKCNVSPQAVTGWVNTGRVEKNNIVVIAKVTGFSLDWLITGNGDKFSKPSEMINALLTAHNVEPGPDMRGKIPLISFVQAGDFCEAIDLLQPGDADEWLPCPQSHGPHAYALRVSGDSMTNPYPGQRSYPDGCIVFVDPDRPITNGCRVIAKQDDRREATFKEFREDGGKRWLKPLNPQYPLIEMTDDIHICGVVIGQYWPE